MPARNRYHPPLGRVVDATQRRADVRPATTCVSISRKHVQQDKELAKATADELMAIEVDVWLDAYDQDTQAAAALGEVNALSLATERGILNSTHLLAILSSASRDSWWVPFKIGSARGNSRDLAFLDHNELKNRPAWLTLGTSLPAVERLMAWAQGLSTMPSTTRQAVASLRYATRRIDSYLPYSRAAY